MAPRIEVLYRAGQCIAFRRLSDWHVPAAQEHADLGGKKAWVVYCGISHPLAGWLVADHEAGLMAVPVRQIGKGRQSQLLADERDVRLLPGQEQPAGADAEFFRIGLQQLGGIEGVDADRVEKNVLSDAAAKEPLHLDQLRRLERALAAALGVDR